MVLRPLRQLLNVTALSLLAVTATAQQASNELNIVQKTCTGCHLPTESGGLTRIENQRKTPEGWEMTISRMQLIHQLKISNQESSTSGEVKRQLVKHLADTQGLAPSEAAPYRYLIEQDSNRIEDFKPEMNEMCGRCHTNGRYALQRRTEPEWEALVHYHLGQYPSVEYSLYGRDRDWLKIAMNETVPELSKRYPLESKAWQDWQAEAKPELEGRWRLVGEVPGKGFFSGVMTARKKQTDNYSLSFDGHYSNGKTLKGSGNAVIFTGYEWRGSLQIDGENYRQIFASDAAGKRMDGKMFAKNAPELGTAIQAVKDNGQSELLAVWPQQLRRGETSRLQLAGTALSGELVLPAGVSLIKIISSSKDLLVAEVKTADTAPMGRKALAVGTSTIKDAIAVYNSIDSLQVSPSYTVARVGGEGSVTEKLHASFVASGIDAGADGLLNTADDIQLGRITSNWHVEPWDDVAKNDGDVKFAGSMDKHTGIFTPAAAGPNPLRKQSTNNAGNLRVVATTANKGQPVTAEAHLIVTVQRWNNPPLK
jgi:quinohemoprotein amine dehydrogenase